jgi:hypothetical protein
LRCSALRLRCVLEYLTLGKLYLRPVDELHTTGTLGLRHLTSALFAIIPFGRTFVCAHGVSRCRHLEPMCVRVGVGANVGVVARDVRSGGGHQHRNNKFFARPYNYPRTGFSI